MFFSAIKAMASNTFAVGAIDHTVEPFRARIPLIVPAIFMFYLRPDGRRIQRQSGDLVNQSQAPDDKFSETRENGGTRSTT
jgi:hypothetical protein